MSDHTESPSNYLARPATIDSPDKSEAQTTDDGYFTPVSKREPVIQHAINEPYHTETFNKPVFAPTTKSPTKVKLSRLTPDDIKLEIIQQPEKARVCGFSVMDRRPIFPPPVIKLTGNLDILEDSSSLVMFASLWSRDLQQCVSYSHKAAPAFSSTLLDREDCGREGLVLSEASEELVTEKYRITPTAGYIQSMIIMGQLVTECCDLYDQNKVKGKFFVYNDLAIRSSGFYRLKFDLYQMNEMFTGSPPLATLYSNVFQAFSPKSFPGLADPTPLSACFARQGIAIRMRTKPGGVKRKYEAEEYDD
ncbi:hypothetical protein HDU79_007820 [Rhizoclosmatium sp. JEL0117]|nr:hypothetical protein HDU79_007820 [Rhizoclosmatium sp. JEL0117]